MKPISFTTATTRQWLKLPAATRKRIDAKLAGYGVGDVKRLKARSGVRLRVGDWRVIFIEESSSIVVIAVGNRKDIYD